MENKSNNVEKAVSSLKSTNTVKVKKSTVKKTKKQKLVIDWPSVPFTIADLQKSYPKSPNITIRFRINQGKAKNKIVELGKNVTDMGRPTLLFCKAPVTSEMLKGLDMEHVVLNEQYVSMVEVKTCVAKFSQETTEQNVVQSPQVAINKEANA